MIRKAVTFYYDDDTGFVARVEHSRELLDENAMFRGDVYADIVRAAKQDRDECRVEWAMFLERISGKFRSTAG